MSTVSLTVVLDSGIIVSSYVITIGLLNDLMYANHLYAHYTHSIRGVCLRLGEPFATVELPGHVRRHWERSPYNHRPSQRESSRTRRTRRARRESIRYVWQLVIVLNPKVSPTATCSGAGTRLRGVWVFEARVTPILDLTYAQTPSGLLTLLYDPGAGQSSLISGRGALPGSKNRGSFTR